MNAHVLLVYVNKGPLNRIRMKHNPYMEYPTTWKNLTRSGASHRFATIALFLCVGFFGVSTFAQEKDPQKSPARYQSFLWLTAESKPTPELFTALDQLGITGTNVAGTSSSELHLNTARPFYVDHVAGKGWLYLDDAKWKETYQLWREDRLLGGRARPVDLFEPSVIDAMKLRIDQVVTPFRKRRASTHPFGLSLDDEISFGRRNIPVEFGFSALCLKAFREELKTRYISTKKLADAWETKQVKNFDAVIPLTTAEARRRAFIQDNYKWNFAPWAEHREFIEKQYAALLKDLVRHTQDRVGKTIPIGFTGGSSPSPFSGLDWSRVLEVVDFVEPYDDGGSRELVRSFAKDGTIILRTLFRDERHPEANIHELWDYFLRGDHGVILWSSRDCLEGTKTLTPTPWAKSFSPTLKQLDDTSMAAWMAAKPAQAKIAIVESAASNKAHWLLDGQHGGSSWIDRKASYERNHSSQDVTRESWQKLLEDLHLEYVHIPARDLGRIDLSQFQAIVLPRTIALSKLAIQTIRQFARTKTVIADCQCALFDEKLKAINEKDDGLDNLFGITRSNRIVRLRQNHFDKPALLRRNVLRFAESGIKLDKGVASTLRLENSPCMIVNRHGENGRTVYLNLLTYNYLSTRRLNERVPLLDELRGVFRASGIRPFAEVRVQGDNIPPIRIHHREDADAHYIAVIRNWRQSAFKMTAKELAALKTIDIEVLLPAAFVIDDLVGVRKPIPNRRTQPERMSSIITSLPPFRALIFKLPRTKDVRNR
ncbi:MAG: hypothetical protein ACI97A_001178 [Planctomycetota bacterium]|jgi:hypothetical protein